MRFHHHAKAASLTLVATLLVLAACSPDSPTAPPRPGISDAATADRTGSNAPPIQGSERLRNLVVIYLENHSFDNLYGEFAGANGLANAGQTQTQVNLAGNPFATLPSPGGAFPLSLPNAPFSIEQYVPIGMNPPDLVHRYYQEQLQIDGGRMDKYAAISDAKGLVMGFYHTANLPLATEAANNVLCDNFFHGAFGGSFLNHIYLISPMPPDAIAPPSIRTVLDQNGMVIADRQATTDGTFVNTSYSVNTPHPAGVNPVRLVPNLRNPTIGDRLSEKGISWAWYSGGWNDAVAGNADRLFQFHHQPFVYFQNYADGTAAKAAHLKDEQEFIAAARAGRLPTVSFVKPLGEVNEHPGYTNVLSGEQHVVDLLNALRSSPAWKHTAVIITYDENGGFWDHVAPPVIDRFGPGTRVPTLVISPLARHGYVDHTMYETSSILAFIERVWGLAPLSLRDASANDMRNAFDFQQGVGEGQ